MIYDNDVFCDVFQHYEAYFQRGGTKTQTNANGGKLKPTKVKKTDWK